MWRVTARPMLFADAVVGAAADERKAREAMSAKLLVLYHQPTDSAAFDAYYRETHAPIARALPGLRSLTINDGPIATPGGPAPYHVTATLSFDSLAALQGAMGS